jgi:hypothetical protein
MAYTRGNIGLFNEEIADRRHYKIEGDWPPLKEVVLIF